MGRQEQLRLAYSQAEEARKKREVRHGFVVELDGQLERALARIEVSLSGQDVHKWLAEEMTDDCEHPVSVTQVYDWLSRRNGRRPPAELIAIVYENDLAFAAFWNDRHGYSIPEKLMRIPWEQERAMYRKALAEFGCAGEVKLRAIGNAKPEETP